MFFLTDYVPYDNARFSSQALIFLSCPYECLFPRIFDCHFVEVSLNWNVLSVFLVVCSILSMRPNTFLPSEVLLLSQRDSRERPFDRGIDHVPSFYGHTLAASGSFYVPLCLLPVDRFGLL